jgi:hypothetical protein
MGQKLGDQLTRGQQTTWLYCAVSSHDIKHIISIPDSKPYLIQSTLGATVLFLTSDD